MLFLRPSAAPFSVVLAGSLAAIAIAWAIEWGLGLPPCDLCYTQRHAYWAAIGFAGMGLLAGPPVWAGASPLVRRSLLGLALAGVAASGAFAAYHAGIEWGWWPGPDSCSGTKPMPDSLDDFKSILNSDARVVTCDQAPMRVLGLSFAGLNVLYALGLILVTLASVRFGAQGGRVTARVPLATA